MRCLVLLVSSAISTEPLQHTFLVAFCSIYLDDNVVTLKVNSLKSVEMGRRRLIVQDMDEAVIPRDVVQSLKKV